MSERTIRLKIEINGKDAEASAKRLKNAVEGIDDVRFGSLKSELRKIKDEMSGAASSFVGNIAADAVSAITSKLKEGAQAWFNYTSNLKGTQTGFATLIGDAQKAKDFLKELQDFSRTTPFEAAGFNDLATRLLGAKVELKEIKPLLGDIGNLVAGTGKATQERFEGVATAITQIISKQKVSAEEMEQLAERGIPAWSILSEAIGKSQAETRKLAEEGVISSDIMVKALQKVSQEKFGEAMAKQATVGNNAINKITEIALQVSSVAFQPIYDKIESLASEALKEVQAQGNDFNAVGSVIGKYVVAGATSVISAGISGLTSYLAENISDQFNNKPTQTPFFLKAFEVLAEGVGKGLGYEWDLFGKNVKSTTPVVKQTADEVKKTADNAKSIPNLGKQLDAQKAAADAKKLSEEITKLAVDLSSKLLFLGESSEVASVKQNLLTKGISDFNSAQAQSVIGIAENIDKRKKQIDEDEKYADKLKDLREDLRQVRNDADFEVAFPKATELDIFNRKVKETMSGFSELRAEIEATRRSINSAQWSKDFGGLLDAVKEITQNIDEQINEQRFSKIDGFSAKMLKLGEDIQKVNNIKLSTNTNDTNGVNIFPIDFANQVEKNVNAILTFKRIAGTDIVPPEQVKRLKDYLTTLGSVMVGNEGNRQPIFSEKEADALIQKILRLAEVTKEAGKAEGLKNYQDSVTNLTDKINEAANASEFYRVKKELEKDTYKNLLPSQKEYLENLAKEADYKSLDKGLQEQLETARQGNRELSVYEQTLNQIDESYAHLSDSEKENLLSKAAQIDAVKELNRQYEETYHHVRELLNILTDDTESFSDRFKDAFKYIKDEIQSSFLDKISANITTQILGFDPNKSKNPVVAEISEGNKYLKEIRDALTGNSKTLFGGNSSPISSTGGSWGGWISNALGSLGGGSGNLGNRNGINSPYVLNYSGGQSFDEDNPFASVLGSGSSASNGNIFSNLKNLFSTKEGGLFAARQNMLSGKTSKLGGIMGGIGDIASLIAPLLGGGRLSSVVGMAGTGASIGSMFGPIGAGIGAAAGALIGLFTGGTRKQDEQARTQAYLAVSAEFDKMIAALDTSNNRPPQIQPSDARTQADSIIAQYNSAMSQLKDSKTRKIALAEVTNTTGVIYRKNQQLNNAIQTALQWQKDDANRQKVSSSFTGEFKDGIYMDSSFRAQYDEFKRLNGLMPGAYTGRDYIKAIIGDGEMVLNAVQQMRVIQNARAGYDNPFVDAGIPNVSKFNTPEPPKFATGASLSPLTSSSSVSKSNAASEPDEMNFTFDFGDLFAGIDKQVKVTMSSKTGKKIVLGHVKKRFNGGSDD